MAPGCASIGATRNRNSIALLSDIHIPADPLKTARNVNMTDNLKTVVDEVVQWPELPGRVFINGDLAFNSGELGDYQSVVGLVRPMREAGLPVYLNMGNHDNREHFWTILKSSKSVQPKLPGRQATIVRMESVNWFMLDSMIKTLTTPGRLGDEQRAWLAAALDANADKPAIVMVHHQPGPLAPGKPGGGLEDAAELLAVLRPRRQVKAYFFGHTHRWGVSQDESGIHLINLPPTAYVFEEGQPSGWVHATVQQAGLQLEFRCLDHTHKAHGQVTELVWRSA